jgi:hypothetical protein
VAFPTKNWVTGIGRREFYMREISNPPFTRGNGIADMQVFSMEKNNLAYECVLGVPVASKWDRSLITWDRSQIFGFFGTGPITLLLNN